MSKGNNNNLKTKDYGNFNFKPYQKSGITGFNDIIYALDLQTEYDEAAGQTAYLQMEGARTLQTR